MERMVMEIEVQRKRRMPMMKGWLDRVRVDNRQKGLSGEKCMTEWHGGSFHCTHET